MRVDIGRAADGLRAPREQLLVFAMVTLVTMGASAGGAEIYPEKASAAAVGQLGLALWLTQALELEARGVLATSTTSSAPPDRVSRVERRAGLRARGWLGGAPSLGAWGGFGAAFTSVKALDVPEGSTDVVWSRSVEGGLAFLLRGGFAQGSWWSVPNSVDLPLGTSVDLASGWDAMGHPFPGIDSGHTWLVSLSCGRCQRSRPERPRRGVRRRHQRGRLRRLRAHVHGRPALRRRHRSKRLRGMRQRQRQRPRCPMLGRVRIPS